MARLIEELYYELRTRTEGLEHDLEGAERQLGKLESFILAHPVAATGALAAALLEIGKKAVDAAEETDGAMRTIAASLGQPLENLKELGEQLDAIANKAGRATSEIEKAAVQAAQQRPGTSPQEVGNVVQAATLFSDATGTQLSASISLLDQVMAEFRLDSSQALEVLSQIDGAAKAGHVSVTDLASAFIASAPIAAKFGLDFETTLRAITTLTSVYGISGEQVGRTLRSLDAEGIKQLAAQSTLAGDSLERMAKDADTVRDSAERAGQRVKNELGQALKEIGNTLLPPVRTGFQDLAAILDFLVKFKMPDDNGINALLRSAGAALKFIPGLSDVGNALGAVAAANAQKPKVLGEPEFHTYAQPLPPPPLPLTSEQKTQVANDLASIQKLFADFGNSTNTILAGVSKSAVDTSLNELETFSQKFEQARTEIENKLRQLQSTTPNLPKSVADQFNAELKSLADAYAAGIGARLDNLNAIAAKEADDIRAKVGKALGDITGQVGTLGLDAIKQQNDALRTQIDLSTSLGVAEKLRLSHEVDIAQLLEEQKAKAQDAVRDVGRVIQAAALTAQTDPTAALTAVNAKAIALHGIEQQLIQDGQQRLGLSADEVKQGDGYKEIEDAILKLDKERADILAAILGHHKDLVDLARIELQHTIDVARGIQEAVGGALQLAEAFHLVGGRTASVLSNVAQIASSVPVLVKQIQDLDKSDAKGNPLATFGSVVGAALPIVGGLASLVSLFGESPEEKAHKQAIEDNSAALRHLTDKLSTVSGTTQAGAASVLGGDFLQRAFREYAKELATGDGKVHLDKLGLTADEIDRLNAAAAAYGIKLDGSIESLIQLKQASDAASKSLGRLGTDYQSEQTYYSGLSAVEGLTGVDAFNVNALAGASQSPFLAQLLGGFDLNTQAGRDAAKKQLLEAYQRGAPNSTNPFTSGELGGLDVDQLEAAIKQWSDALGQLPPLVQSAADRLKADLGNLSQQASVLDEGPVAQLGDKVQTYAKDFGGALASLADGLDLTKQSDIDAFKQRLQELYKGLEDGTATVDTSTFSIDDWKTAIADLVGSVDSAAAAFATAAQKISAAENQISIQDDILGTNPVTSVGEYATAYGIDLSAYDLGTQGGRDAAIAALQGMFRGLDPNDPNYQNTVHEIQSLVDKIRQLPAIDTGSAAGAGAAVGASAGASGGGPRTAESSAATVASQASVDRLGDYLATMLQVDRDQLKALQTIVARFTQPIITGPLYPPALPAGFGAPTSTSSTAGPASVVNSGPVFNIDTRIEITLPNAVVTGRDDVDALAKLLTPSINRELAAALRRALKLAGDTTLPTS